MVIRLGNLALDAEPTRPGLTDPMLADQAWAAYRGAPERSALELRGALVLVCLAARELVGHTVALAGAHRYEVGPLGGALWGLIKRAGGAPEEALAALATLYPPRGQDAPVAAAVTPAPAPAAPAPAAPSASAVTEEDKRRFGPVRAKPVQDPAKEG